LTGPGANTKSCKVHFFELRLLPDDQQAEGQQWSRLLHGLETTSNCGRTGAHECDYNGVTIEGVPVFELGEPGAALAVGRAVTPRQRNMLTSVRSDLPIDADHEPVEETFVSFFANNVIGLVLSTISAPSHAAVATWLNTVAAPRFAGTDALWHATPIVDPEKYQLIAEAQEVTSVTFALKPDNVPAGSGSLLAGLITEGRQFGHGVRIEVKLTAGRGRPGEASRESLVRVARDVVGLRTEGVNLEKAQAKIRRTYGSAVEPVDILNHRLAREVDIPVTSGRSLDSAAVFAETRTAYADMRDDLRAAIGLS